MTSAPQHISVWEPCSERPRRIRVRSEAYRPGASFYAPAHEVLEGDAEDHLAQLVGRVPRRHGRGDCGPGGGAGRVHGPVTALLENGVGAPARPMPFTPPPWNTRSADFLAVRCPQRILPRASRPTPRPCPATRRGEVSVLPRPPGRRSDALPVPLLPAPATTRACVGARADEPPMNPPPVERRSVATSPAIRRRPFARWPKDREHA